MCKIHLGYKVKNLDCTKNVQIACIIFTMT